MIPIRRRSFSLIGNYRERIRHEACSHLCQQLDFLLEPNKNTLQATIEFHNRWDRNRGDTLITHFMLHNRQTRQILQTTLAIIQEAELTNKSSTSSHCDINHHMRHPLTNISAHLLDYSEPDQLNTHTITRL